jgi:hypothetical protein
MTGRQPGYITLLDAEFLLWKCSGLLQTNRVMLSRCCFDLALLQTSVDGVYAIGDVAAFPLLVADGAVVRQEHVTHARSSAAQAAKALMGKAQLMLHAMRLNLSCGQHVYVSLECQWRACLSIAHKPNLAISLNINKRCLHQLLRHPVLLLLCLHLALAVKHSSLPHVPAMLHAPNMTVVHSTICQVPTQRHTTTSPSSTAGSST